MRISSAAISACRVSQQKESLSRSPYSKDAKEDHMDITPNGLAQTPYNPTWHRIIVVTCDGGAAARAADEAAETPDMGNSGRVPLMYAEGVESML